jgi:hypothetical protein
LADEAISRERAERIARSQHCPQCLEYSFKKLVVRPASASQREAYNAVWLVHRVCGVCRLEEEIALDAEGDVVYMV